VLDFADKRAKQIINGLIQMIESQHKGRNALSVRSTVVDEELVRHQCFVFPSVLLTLLVGEVRRFTKARDCFFQKFSY